MGKPKAESNKKAESKLSVKRKAEKGTGGRAKKGKQEKDPNKPKRPSSAFFVFMEEFRKKFKEENPRNKLVSVVGKAGGDKWKSMSEADKAPYVAKANKRKAEYEKSMAAYNDQQTGGGGKKSSKREEDDEEEEGDSDKSKSEVNDEDDDEGSDEDGDEDDDDE